MPRVGMPSHRSRWQWKIDDLYILSLKKSSNKNMFIIFTLIFTYIIQQIIMEPGFKRSNYGANYIGVCKEFGCMGENWKIG